MYIRKHIGTTFSGLQKKKSDSAVRNADSGTVVHCKKRRAK